MLDKLNRVGIHKGNLSLLLSIMPLKCIGEVEIQILAFMASLVDEDERSTPSYDHFIRDERTPVNAGAWCST
jgi:hypothetical protein